MRQCFVISPIGEEGSEIRKHADSVFKYIIRPAMKECGIAANRSDHLDKPGKISEQMFRAIFESDLCIAVLTRFNPNAFYELAIAHSAQRPVIILIEKGQPLPFDIQDLRCVHYDLEIDSYMEKIHIRRIVNYVKEFEAGGWKAPNLFGAYGCNSSPNPQELHVHGDPEEYGIKNWAKLLQDTQESFDLMGNSLMRWRKIENFQETVIQKARDGCKIRILLCHPENAILPAISDDLALQITNINQNFTFFTDIARECGNIEVRQIRNGISYIFLTLTDQFAVVVQRLVSQKWGNGPLFECTRENPLYKIYRKEFEELWEMCSLTEPAKVVTDEPPADEYHLVAETAGGPPMLPRNIELEDADGK